MCPEKPPASVLENPLLWLLAVGDNAAMQFEATKAEPPKRIRRWFQFSLRSLLTGIALLCITLGLWKTFGLPIALQDNTGTDGGWDLTRNDAGLYATLAEVCVLLILFRRRLFRIIGRTQRTESNDGFAETGVHIRRRCSDD